MNHTEWDIDNLPNRLTILRIVLIPVIVASIYLQTAHYAWAKASIEALNYLAAGVFILASITDFFDGFIARKKNIVTVFGSFLDPIADKFLVISTLIVLLAVNRIHVLIVLILVLREMYITALRLLAQEKGLSIPVGQLGKWKTATQMIGIPLLLANGQVAGVGTLEIGTYAIYLASLFSLYSAFEYSLGLVKKIKKYRQEKKIKQQSSQNHG